MLFEAGCHLRHWRSGAPGTCKVVSLVVACIVHSCRSGKPRVRTCLNRRRQGCNTNRITVQQVRKLKRCGTCANRDAGFLASTKRVRVLFVGRTAPVQKVLDVAIVHGARRGRLGSGCLNLGRDHGALCHTLVRVCIDHDVKGVVSSPCIKKQSTSLWWTQSTTVASNLTWLRRFNQAVTLSQIGRVARRELLQSRNKYLSLWDVPCSSL